MKHPIRNKKPSKTTMTRVFYKIVEYQWKFQTNFTSQISEGYNTNGNSLDRTVRTTKSNNYSCET